MVIRDGTAEGLLRKFLATKRIEGKAESTIEYYRQQLTMFLHNVGKLLPEITTFDLRFYLSAYKERRKVRNRTLDNIRKCLSTFFTWLTDEEFIQRKMCIRDRSKEQKKAYAALQRYFRVQEKKSEEDEAIVQALLEGRDPFG